MFAHSLRLVLPTITAPAARSRATSGASRLVTLFASARLPAVVGSGPGAFDIVLDQHRLAGERAAQVARIDPPRLVDRGRIDGDDRMELGIDPRDPLERGRGRSPRRAAAARAAADAAASASAVVINNLRIAAPLLLASARREQRVERSRRLADLLQPRIAQAAVPIELHRAIDVAVVDQQLGRGAVAGRALIASFSASPSNLRPFTATISDPTVMPALNAALSHRTLPILPSLPTAKPPE